MIKENETRNIQYHGQEYEIIYADIMNSVRNIVSKLAITKYSDEMKT